jgi:hypothetical protein
MDFHGRVDPPRIADEMETLLGFLDFQRGTFLWKCEGLTPEHLGTAEMRPSELTFARHGPASHRGRAQLARRTLY